MYYLVLPGTSILHTIGQGRTIDGLFTVRTIVRVKHVKSA